jgi:hypothetical protein
VQVAHPPAYGNTRGPVNTKLHSRVPSKLAVIEFDDAFTENAATRQRRLDAGPGAWEPFGAREPPRAAQRSGARKLT